MDLYPGICFTLLNTVKVMCMYAMELTTTGNYGTGTTVGKATTGNFNMGEPVTSYILFSLSFN